MKRILNLIVVIVTRTKIIQKNLRAMVVTMTTELSRI